MQFIAEAIACVFLFIVGGVAFIRPRVIREMTRRRSRWGASSEYVGSRSYLWNTRVVGILAIVIAVVLALALGKDLGGR